MGKIIHAKYFYLQAVEDRAFVYLHRDGSSLIFFLSGEEVLQVLGVQVSHWRFDRVKCKVI
jgi:hypothetical protein